LVRPGTSADWPVLSAAVVTIGGALVLGALSYRFVELPFIRRESRSLAGPRQAVALRLGLIAVAAAVLGVTLAQVPTNNPLADSLAAGEKVLAAQPPPSTTPPSSTTTVTTA